MSKNTVNKNLQDEPVSQQEPTTQQPVTQPTTDEPISIQVEEVPTAEMQISQLSAEVEQLKKENEKLQKTVARLQSSADKSDTYLTQLVAMKNDFESYKRRMKFSAEQARQEGVASVALKLIEIADTFEIAQKHLTDEETLKAFEMVHQQFEQTLQSLGVQKMDVKGKEFDHMTMNALSQLDCGEENKGKVVEVYKNGYIANDKVLRYAEVIVGA